MPDRKNLKVSEETYEKLREEKGQYETWDGFFHRVLEEFQSVPNEDLRELAEEWRERDTIVGYEYDGAAYRSAANELERVLNE